MKLNYRQRFELNTILKLISASDDSLKSIIQELLSDDSGRQRKAFTELKKLYQTKNINDHRIFVLGFCYLNKVGVPKKHLETAKNLFLHIKNNQFAQNALGCMFYDGCGVERDLKKSFDYFLQAANQGYARAQQLLGRSYQYGRGVEISVEKAIPYFLMSEKQGYAPTHSNLATLHYAGNTVVKDEKVAFEHFTRLLDHKDNADIQFTIGAMYECGHGVAQDNKKAFEWYQRSAEQGYRQAQLLLGEFYDKGIGIDRDYKAACDWWHKAAEKGCERSQNNLGTMYAQGFGVEKDKKTALDWYHRAADNGCPKAQYNLGVYHEQGIVVPMNLETAYLWYLKAQENTRYKSKELEDFLLKKLPALRIEIEKGHGKDDPMDIKKGNGHDDQADEKDNDVPNLEDASQLSVQERGDVKSKRK